MKILQICIWRKGSGITKHVETIIKGLKRYKFEILTYKTRRFRWLFLIIFGLMKNVSKFDLIHAHYIFPQGFLGFIYKILYNKKFILTIHGSDYILLNRYNFLKFILKNADVVLTVSNALKDGLRKFIIPDKVRVVYNCIDVMGKEDKKENIITYIGSLVKIKNVGYLVENFKRERLDYELYIIGDGPERKFLERIAKGCNNIHIIGFVKNPYEILSKSKFFILPSRFEGFGIVLLEAMAFNVLPFANEVGGIPEIVRHNYNGILFREDEINYILRNIHKYEFLRVKFVKNFRKTLKKFSCKKFLKRIMRIYHALSM